MSTVPHDPALYEPPASMAAGGGSAALPWAGAALALAAAGLAGSLYASIGLHLKACPLCFYQRTFIMGVFAVLLAGLIVERARAGLLCLLSLPLSAGGLGVAGFHEYLVLTDKLECPNGLFDLGTVPVQSVTIFALLTAVLLAGGWAGQHSLASCRALAVPGSVVLGLLLAWGCLASSPPPPAAPPKPYDPEKQPLDMCRPPFRAP